MINMVILCGYLGKDPEIRSTQGGNKVASFSLATSEKWTDKKSGERQEKTEWHNVVVWNENIVSVVERFVKKGSLIHITGQLETRKWQDRDGNDRWTTEVVLRFNGKLTLMPNGERNGDGGRRGGDSGGGRDRGGYSDQGRGSGGQGGGSGGGSRGGYADDLDDDIPFDCRPVLLKAA